MSRQYSVQDLAWLLTYFRQTYSKNQEQKAELVDLKTCSLTEKGTHEKIGQGRYSF